MSEGKVGVLFVCHGNICRSPVAEGVFKALVRSRGLERRFRIDSAGTSNYHTGEQPDSRSAEVARQRGIVLDHRARQVGREDLEAFDYVIAMDRENVHRLARLAEGTPYAAKIRLLREFELGGADDLEVPDPYFGGPRGFEDVHDMVDRSCRGLLDAIQVERPA